MASDGLEAAWRAGFFLESGHDLRSLSVLAHPCRLGLSPSTSWASLMGWGSNCRQYACSGRGGAQAILKRILKGGLFY